MTSLDNYDLSNGETLTLDDLLVPLLGASTLDGTVQGPGTLALASGATATLYGLVLDDGAILRVNGTADQFGSITLGSGSNDQASINIKPGGIYAVLSDSTINARGTATIINGGLFERGGTDGLATIDAAFSSSGTLAVTLGTLDLDGAANSLGGTIKGVGTLNLEFGTTTLASGVQIAVGTFGLYNDGTKLTLEGDASDTGSFALGGGAEIYLNGAVLALDKTGQLDGTIIGSGTLLVTGVADADNVVLTGGAVLQVAGTLTEDAFISLGTSTADQAGITVSAGGTYALLSDASINAQGTATILNGGLFEKLGTDGVSTVDPAFVNQGTVDVVIGTLDFAGALTNNATLTASAGATLIIAGALTESTGTSGIIDIGTGATVVVDGAVDSHEIFAFTGTSGTLVIGDASAFGGTISGLQNGDTIDLAGTAVNAVGGSGDDLVASDINQAGTVTASYTLATTGLPTGTPTVQTDNGGGTGIVFNHTGPVAYVPENIIPDSWTAGSGNWDDGDNWLQVVPIPNPPYQENVYEPPVASNDAEIEPGGSTPFTVSYDETDTVNQLTGSAQATLSMTGGTLTINQASGWEGAFSNTGGTLDAVGGWEVDGPTTLSAGATDEVNSGVFGVGAGSLAGKVIGDGTFELLGGNAFTIKKGFSITAGGFVLGVNGDGFGSDTTLDTNLSYTGSFVLADYTGNAATLTLNGTTLALAGQSDLDGLITGTGDVTVNGTAEANLLTVENDATLTLKGTLLQDGVVVLGTGTSPDTTTLDISSTGTWDFVQNTAIEGYGGSAIVNAGLIEKTGGTGNDTISGATFTDTGRIVVSIGTLGIGAATNAIDGAISGAGTLVFDGGVAFTIESGANITTTVFVLAVSGDGYGSNTTLDTNLSYSGSFVLADYYGNAANLFLNGHTLTLSGQSNLNGYFGGAGEALITGTAEIGGLTANNTATLTVSGTAVQDGVLILGTGTAPDDTTLDISTHGTWDFVENTNINGYGDAAISNAGLIELTGGSGTTNITADDFTDSGRITLAVGSLALGASQATIAGTISGPGALIFDGGSNFAIYAGASITTAAWILAVSGDGFGSSTTLDTNLSYAGSFTQSNYSGNSAYLYLNGYTLTLSGTSFFNGYVGGKGQITLSGDAQLGGFEAASGAVLDATGTVTEDGPISLGGTLLVSSGGTYDVTTNDGITTSGTDSISNAGLLEKTGGTGTSEMQGAFSNTGTVDVVTGTLDFVGSGGTLGGTIEGAGTVQLGGGAYKLASTLDLSATELALTGGTNLLLHASLSYGGTLSANIQFGTDTINLAGYTLDLTKSGSLATAYGSLDFIGGGYFEVGASAAVTLNGVGFAGDVLLKNTGTLVEAGTIGLNENAYSGTGTLLNASGATLSLAGTGTAISTGGKALISNAGLIENTSGGTVDIDSAVTNTGTMTDTAGIIALFGGGSLGGTLGGAGEISLEGNASYTFASSLHLDVGTLAIYDYNESTSVTLQSNQSYAGTLNAFVEFGTDSFDLAAHTLTLTNSGSLGSAYAALNLVGGGAFVVAKTATVTLSEVSFAGGVTLDNAGTLIEGYVIELDEDGSAKNGTLLNASGATLSLAATGNAITTGGTAALISNAGLLQNTSGGTVNIDVPITSTGTITDTSGSIDLFGGGTLGGTLNGTGEISLEGNATYTLASTLTLDVGTLAIYDYNDSTSVILRSNESYAGTLNVFAEFGTDNFNLVGHTLTLTNSGSLATAYAAFNFVGGGEFAVGESANVTLNGIGFAGGTLLDNAGTLTEAGTIELDENGSANTGTLLNASGGTLALSATGTAVSSGGTAALVSNAGLIENTSGGTVDIDVPISSSGLITDTTGILELSGGGKLGGTLDGAGEIALDGNGTYTFVSGVKLDVGTLAINATASFSNETATIAGALSGDGTLLAATDRTVVEVNGGSFGGDIAGAGQVGLEEAITFEAGASFSVASLVASADVTLASVSVTNTAADTFSLLASGETVTLASTGTGAFTNLGTFGVHGLEPGTAQVSAPFTNSGYVDVDLAGTLTFLSNVAGTGTMDLDSGTLSLDLGAGSGQVVDFVGASRLHLSNPLDFLGTITGFGASDNIFLEDTTYTTFAFSNNLLTVKDNSTTVASLNITEASNSFTLASENHGILITF
jgi:hypothetical protein